MPSWFNFLPQQRDRSLHRRDSLCNLSVLEKDFSFAVGAGNPQGGEEQCVGGVITEEVRRHTGRV